MNSMAMMMILVGLALPPLEISNLHQNEVVVPFKAEGMQIPDAREGLDYYLKTESNVKISAQFSPQHGGTLYLQVPPNVINEESVHVEWEEDQNIDAFPRFYFTERDNERLYLYENGKPVLAYIYGMISQIGVPANRARAGYVHPVYGMDGEIITDDFPRDHYHHRGLFWTWMQVLVDDKNIDLWTLRGGRQKFERWIYRESGHVCAAFAVQNGWYMGEQRIAEEIVEFVVYRAGETGRAIDVRLKLRSLDKPVTILGAPGKGYSGFNYRPAPRDDDSTVITTNEGVQEDSNHKRFPWADFSARFRGREKMSGLSIFVDKNHKFFPTEWTLRHYGFLGADWPGLDPLEIPSDHYLETNYRVWIHKGNADEGKVDKAYAIYHNPIKLRFIEKGQ